MRRIAAAAGIAAALSSAPAWASGPEVEGAWSRAVAPSARSAVAYLTIRNPGPASDRLVAAEAPGVAGRVELHGHVHEGGVMRMRPVDGIDVPPGGVVELRPGGLHLMLMDLVSPPRLGESFRLVLRFEQAGDVPVQVPVQPAGASGPPRD